MDKSFTQSPSVTSVNSESPISPPGISTQNIIPTPKPSRQFPFLLAGLVLLFGGIFLAKSSVLDQLRLQSKEIACTLEAKICPDGSAVGRTGPNCEFTPCPQITTTSPSIPPDPMASWKTYTDSKYGFEFKYPSEEKIEKGVDKSSGQQFLSIGSANSLKITPEQQGLGIENPYAKITTEPLLVNGKQVSLGGHDIEKTKIVEKIPDSTITTFKIIIPYPNKRDYLIMVNYSFNPGIVDKNIEETFDQILSTFKFLDPNQADPTAGWKMYQGNKFSFKHPVDLETREQGLENQVKEISIVYMRPGYNRPQSEISDGYTFSVHFGTFIQAETLEKVVEQQQEQTKAACSQASFSLTKQVLVDKEKALTYETAGCLGSYITTITSRNNEIFQITQSFSGPVEQINIYKVNLDQILSTFKFLN